MSWMRLSLLLAALSAAMPAKPAMPAGAAFPEKPVRLIVGFAPGGSDIAGRIVAQKLSDLWGQPVVVDNRPGAAGNIGADVTVDGGFTRNLMGLVPRTAM